MFIIGSEDILNEKAYICKNENEILKYYQNNLIIIESIKLAKFCFKEKIPYIVWTNNIVSMIYCHNLKANYFIHEDIKFVSSLQEIANEYLMDSKIALIINIKTSINKAIKHKIDGVIFKSCIQN